MNVWESSCSWIKDRVSSNTYEGFFSQVEAAELDGEELTLRVPNEFVAGFLENTYAELIRDAVAAGCGRRPATLRLEIVPTATPVVAPLPVTVLPRQTAAETHLNARYTFDTFVVGGSNQLAHAASRAASETPGRKYNPLFIYGGVGLGKTHLAHAIGNEIRRQKPHARITYISSEQFMNEFIYALRNNNSSDGLEAFRRRYRNDCDVLLMDDIQFIAGKERTQDEFFHTFNSLHGKGRQIVLTSDKYPQEIPDLEERLRSRFQWGLIADIQAPELETRLAIIAKKSEEEGIELDAEVSLLLATTIKSNVRELEGSLINLAAHASLEGRRIDLAFAREALKRIVVRSANQLTVESVQQAVCGQFNVSLDELKGGRRQRSVALPRQIAMYLCRKALHTSFPELGQRFGGKDHTTVLAACRKIERLVSEDDETRSRVEALQRLLGI